MSITFLVLVLLALLVGLFGFLWQKVRLQANNLAQLSSRIQILETRHEALQNDFSALCSGALGVDSRVKSNEQRVRSLVERLEELEADEQRQGDQTYQNAIEMAQKGSTAQELIEQFDLTSDEADLLIRLYQLER